MADEEEDHQVEEDSWLYGSNAINPEPPEEDGDGDEEDTNNPSEEKETDLLNEDNGNNTSLAEQMEINPEDEEEEEEEGDHEHLGGEMEETDEVPGKKENGSLDSDDSDDDINVVIGDIKSGPSYQIKQRPTLLAPTTAVPAEKPKQPTGKFNIEEFETVGTINGVQAHEFSIDSLEEKPWRKPGADITDYFNYGFNEDTWRSYCERQKKMRMNESGVGLQGLALNVNNSANNSGNSNNRTLTPIANDNSKYTAGLGLMRRAGPPPGRKMTGSIDVIGGNGMMGARREDGTIIKSGFPPNAKENVIQVMTADRREYSRPGGKFDASVPPPPFSGGPSNEPFYDPDPYSYGYEPTQDSQWAPTNTNWTPSGIKELTPLGPPQMVPPPMVGMPPMMGHGGSIGVLAPMGQMPPPHMPMGGPPRNMPPMHNERGDRDRGGDRGERGGDRDRDREHRDRDRNDRDRDRGGDRDRGDRSDRDRDREHRGERERSERGETRDRDRERDRGDRGDRDRNRERDRKSEDPERSSARDESPGKSDRDSGRRSVKPERHPEKRRERSRSRERSTRRRSKSRDRDHKSRDKKKSHKKDKEESD